MLKYVDLKHKKYFFKGVGEGLARLYALAFSPHQKRGDYYDVDVFSQYLDRIKGKENKDYFKAGFFNPDVWQKL